MAGEGSDVTSDGTPYAGRYGTATNPLWWQAAKRSALGIPAGRMAAATGGV